MNSKVKKVKTVKTGKVKNTNNKTIINSKIALQRLARRKKGYFWFTIVTIFIIVFGMLFGIGWTSDIIRYNLKTSISFTGGWQAIANVYDYNNTKNPPNPGSGKGNGDAATAYKFLVDKLNPIGDSIVNVSLHGSHAVSVTVPKSMFKTYADFELLVRSSGNLLFADNKGTNLMLDYKNFDAKKQTINQIRLSDIFANKNSNSVIKSTIDKNRKPILELPIINATNWKKITDLLGKGKLYLWRDIPLMLNKMRNDYTSPQYKNYITNYLATSFNDFLNKPYGKGIQDKKFNEPLFNYDLISKTNPNLIQHRNLLADNIDNLGNPSYLKEIVFQNNDFNFKWDVPYSQLYHNSNSKKISFGSSGSDINYYQNVLPYEEGITNYRAGNTSAFNKDYKQYLINYSDIDAKKSIIQKNNLIITMPTKTQGDQVAGLINAGLAGIEFDPLSHTVINPLISVVAWTITKVFLAIVGAFIVVYLIWRWRLFGLLTGISLGFSIVLSLFLINSLLVQFSPFVFLGILLGLLIVMSSSLLIFNRYRQERKNDLPIISASKIAIKQTLPMCIDVVVILMIIGLVLYWLVPGEVKIFSIALIIGLIIGFISIIFITWFLLYLFVKIKAFDRFKFLDINRKSLMHYWNLVIKTKNERSKKKLLKNSVNQKHIELNNDELDTKQIKKNDKKIEEIHTNEKEG